MGLESRFLAEISLVRRTRVLQLSSVHYHCLKTSASAVGVNGARGATKVLSRDGERGEKTRSRHTNDTFSI